MAMGDETPQKEIQTSHIDRESPSTHFITSVSIIFPKTKTRIGNDVWIGQNSTILPGVHIGDGAIIGLNSVVGSDVDPYTIVAGNPAKVIRKRFDNQLIKLLLKLKWWDKSVQEINDLIPILTDDNLAEVKKKLKKLV